MPRSKAATTEPQDLLPFSEIIQNERNANRGTKRGGEVIR